MSEKRSSFSEEPAAASSLVEESVTEEQKTSSESFTATDDPNIVVFDGPSDPEDPQNWPNKHKYVLVGLLSAMQTMV